MNPAYNKGDLLLIMAPTIFASATIGLFMAIGLFMGMSAVKPVDNTSPPNPVPCEISIETSVNGVVDWKKVPFGTVHVIVNDGKLVNIQSIKVPEPAIECALVAGK